MTTQTAVPPGRHLGRETRRLREMSVLDPRIVRRAVVDALLKLDPRVMVHKPVMFVVYVGSIWTTLLFVRDAPRSSGADNLFTGLVVLFLWFTVLFGNFADAMAEGRGKAHADALRRARQETVAHVLHPDGTTKDTPSRELKVGDRCVVEAGQAIPGDGEVIEGMAMVDESAITGESAPVVRESGGDLSAVTGGTVVLSDRIVVSITSPPGQTFLDRMIGLVEGANRQRTQNELALTVVLVSLTFIFLVAVSTFQLVAIFSGVKQPIVLLVALLVRLSPTTIGALISAIGIAGMDRMIRHNVLAMSGRAVEAAGDVTTLLLDKTGTITFGNRMATEFVPVGDTDEHALADAAHLSSLADETPEGRSIVQFAQHYHGCQPSDIAGANLVNFSAKTKMSGIDLPNRKIRKGAVAAVSDWVRANGGAVPPDMDGIAARIATGGGTPLAVADENTLLGIIHLKDTVKPGISQRLGAMRPFGIRTVMVTGDNPATAAAIAAEAGVDEFIAEATPEDKMDRIRAEQAGGDLVAMTGDGTNDAPALALADVGVAMNSGTQAAKEAGNLVDLDSDPTKLMEIVEVGKQLLITRGALTTFSVCNDVAKYFVAIPAMVHAVYPELGAIDILNLHNPHTAILSAVIFNAIIIVLMIPLALRGVRVKAMGATAMLRRNVLIYGVGGLITPFVLIKLIDIGIVAPLGIH
ncbi:potassium-transporting ATPase ATP-binding subunit [Mycobacterium mantenii]|uniref:Potassium-transporting ATPase ATP-binding subunit n=1 Tax=Mycobacterium mantenii TaxID=560555 RepID=A0A1X0F8V6_MYCNT|nr:potassium-transporting ATPase subunit KdpB [Mycobacterium mantenii]MCV7245447.1 potassium-transporting ATPase subunit KdpB [Mycobacterium mantenii]ORA98160.1 potassium-transporting ATPase subunit B [Mycobacterium mantenii]BBY37836.1 potassium-transporting ATPase ATP-binding subunit [Mycobacterium mantenii]